MCIGLPPADANVVLGTSPLMYAALKLTVTGSIVGDMQDAEAALQYARRGALTSICEVRGLSRFPESVQQLKRGEVPGKE
jgi:alcohol dehydrogenase, propanol-preferring